MSKFKVGDKVRCIDNRGGCGFTVGDIYTVFGITPDAYDGADLIEVAENDSYGMFDYRFELYVEPVTPCSTCDRPSTTVQVEYSAAEEEEESYLLEYRRTFPESGDEYVRHTIKGEPAGDLAEVLVALRNFLSASGFTWVAELNAVTEDGTWHSSAE